MAVINCAIGWAGSAKSWRASSSRGRPKISVMGAPSTKSPTGLISTSRRTRSGHRTASSAAIQPPSDMPTTSTVAKLEAVEHVEHVKGGVLDVVDVLEAL